MNDEIPLFSEREQERVLEGEPVGTVVTRTSAMDRDGTFPNNAVYYYIKKDSEGERYVFNFSYLRTESKRERKKEKRLETKDEIQSLPQ